MIQLLKVVTAFTIGHSVTLITEAVGWFNVPSQPVEILIALSILISAVHAMRPLFPGCEVLIAGGFGLVHGFAFATLITELGVTPWRMALSILGFNIGIELMQLLVIAITVPWLVLLSVTPVYPVVRMAGACYAAVASFGWLMERALSQVNPLASLVNTVADHALWIVLLLACTALVSTWLQRMRKLEKIKESKTSV